MKVKSSAVALTGELESDFAVVMLIEKRHSAKIGSTQARDLIQKVKDVLLESQPTRTLRPTFLFIELGGPRAFRQIAAN